MLKNARLALCVGFVASFAVAGSAQAQTTSDKSAAILVWPRVMFDSEGSLFGAPTDTLISLSSNATSDPKQAHCFLVNATSHCSNSGVACLTSSTCDGGTCVPSWNETDFNIYLTQEQPLSWLAGSGMSSTEVPIGQSYGRRCNNPAGSPCFTNAQCGVGFSCVLGPHGGQNNVGTGIPPVPEDPFVGALLCIQYDRDPVLNRAAPDQSITTNALIGEAAIMTLGEIVMDGAKYNAVGLRAKGGPTADTDNTLELGTPPDATGQPTADYDGCAAQLIFNHYFDGAQDPMAVGDGNNSSNGVTDTSLTLVPCGNNILERRPGNVVAQFLVFNEFEQRFSASTRVDCLYDKRISNIDTPNNARSIWSTGVSGTLTGQTRIKGVGDAATGVGLTGVATLGTETAFGITRAAYSLDQKGQSANGDLLIIP